MCTVSESLPVCERERETNRKRGEREGETNAERVRDRERGQHSRGAQNEPFNVPISRRISLIHLHGDRGKKRGAPLFRCQGNNFPVA